MKPRRVVISLELVTDKPISELRDKEFWASALARRSMLPRGSKETPVHGVQVNVIKPTKPEGGGKA